MKKGLIAVGILGGLGAIGFALYSFYKKQFDLIKQFTYKIVGLDVQTLSETLISGVIKFEFCSISDIEIVVKSFYLDFFVEGVRVGYIEDTSVAEGFVIPANGCNVLEFRFAINPRLILGNISDIVLLITKEKKVDVLLEGQVKLESGFVKATVPLKFNCALPDMNCDM
jgi:LEA14-like dessication related protein